MQLLDFVYKMAEEPQEVPSLWGGGSGGILTRNQNILTLDPRRSWIFWHSEAKLACDNMSYSAPTLPQNLPPRSTPEI